MREFQRTFRSELDGTLNDGARFLGQLKGAGPAAEAIRGKYEAAAQSQGRDYLTSEELASKEEEYLSLVKKPAAAVETALGKAQRARAVLADPNATQKTLDLIFDKPVAGAPKPAVYKGIDLAELHRQGEHQAVVDLTALEVAEETGKSIVINQPKEMSLKNLGEGREVVGKPIYVKTKTVDGWVPYVDKEHASYVKKGMLTVIISENGTAILGDHRGRRIAGDIDPVAIEGTGPIFADPRRGYTREDEKAVITLLNEKMEAAGYQETYRHGSSNNHQKENFLDLAKVPLLAYEPGGKKYTLRTQSELQAFFKKHNMEPSKAWGWSADWKSSVGDGMLPAPDMALQRVTDLIHAKMRFEDENFHSSRDGPLVEQPTGFDNFGIRNQSDGHRLTWQEMSAAVATSNNEAFFWSGRTNGIGGMDHGASVARKAGGKTLEMLLREKGIQMPEYDPSNALSVSAWDEVSRLYASHASGEVRVVLGDSRRPGSVWERIEFDTLKKNPRVKQITAVNPRDGAERILFAR